YLYWWGFAHFINAWGGLEMDEEVKFQECSHSFVYTEPAMETLPWWKLGRPCQNHKRSSRLNDISNAYIPAYPNALFYGANDWLGKTDESDEGCQGRVPFIYSSPGQLVLSQEKLPSSHDPGRCHSNDRESESARRSIDHGAVGSSFSSPVTSGEKEELVVVSGEAGNGMTKVYPSPRVECSLECHWKNEGPATRRCGCKAQNTVPLSCEDWVNSAPSTLKTPASHSMRATDSWYPSGPHNRDEREHHHSPYFQTPVGVKLLHDILVVDRGGGKCDTTVVRFAVDAREEVPTRYLRTVAAGETEFLARKGFASGLVTHFLQETNTEFKCLQGSTAQGMEDEQLQTAACRLLDVFHPAVEQLQHQEAAQVSLDSMFEGQDASGPYAVRFEVNITRCHPEDAEESETSGLAECAPAIWMALEEAEVVEDSAHEVVFVGRPMWELVLPPKVVAQGVPSPLPKAEEPEGGRRRVCWEEKGESGAGGGRESLSAVDP
ncbi:unnamed protein product, partial [Choristocarpus tenellus]